MPTPEGEEIHCQQDCLFRSHQGEATTAGCERVDPRCNNPDNPFAIFHHPDRPITRAEIERLPLPAHQRRYLDPETVRDLDAIIVEERPPDPPPPDFTPPGCLEFPLQGRTIRIDRPYLTRCDEYEIRLLTQSENWLHDSKKTKRLGIWYWRRNDQGELYLEPGELRYPPGFKDEGYLEVGGVTVETETTTYSITTTRRNPFAYG